MSNGTPTKAVAMNATTVTAARVHTPGKYVIVFGVLPLCIIASVVAGAILGGRHYQSPFAFEFRTNEQGKKTAYYPLPEILVDLAPDSNGRRAFLKTRVSVAVVNANEEENRKLDEMRPLLAERLTLFLRALRPDDLEGTENMIRLKEAMVHRLNLVLERDLVVDVVLQNLIVQ